jgi:hypothetical protein
LKYAATFAFCCTWWLFESVMGKALIHFEVTANMSDLTASQEADNILLQVCRCEYCPEPSMCWL